MTVKSGQSLSGLESRDINVCAWQVEVDFGVLWNKNNDCVISGLREFSCIIGSYQIFR